MAAGTNGICLRWCRAIAGVFELQLALSEKDRESTSDQAKKGAPDSLELWHRKMLCKRFSIRNERWHVLQVCSHCIACTFSFKLAHATKPRCRLHVSEQLHKKLWPAVGKSCFTKKYLWIRDVCFLQAYDRQMAEWSATMTNKPRSSAQRPDNELPELNQQVRSFPYHFGDISAWHGLTTWCTCRGSTSTAENLYLGSLAALRCLDETNSKESTLWSCNPLGGNQDMDGRCSWAACLLNMFCLTWMIQEQSCRAKMPFVKKWPTCNCNYFATWQNMRIKLAKRLQDRPKDETTGLLLEIWSLWPGPLNCCPRFEHMSAPHMSNSCPTSHESLHRWVVNACCWCLTCMTCQVPLRSLFWYLLGWRWSPWRAVQRGNLLHPPRTCCRPSALMTVCVGCSATLRVLPRPAVAIHLYSWCWHIGYGYKTWSPTTCPQHLHIQLFKHTLTIFNTQYVHTPHLYTHFCPTQLFHTQFFDTHFPTQYLYTQHFYTHSCPTPLFHPQHFHTRLFHIHTHTHPTFTHHTFTHFFHQQHFYTEVFHTHTHTSLRHAFLAHTDPPPSAFSFLPFPSRLHLSFATHWKNLTCGVIRSFSWFFICKSWNLGARMKAVDTMEAMQSMVLQLRTGLEKSAKGGAMITRIFYTHIYM